MVVIRVQKPNRLLSVLYYFIMAGFIVFGTLRTFHPVSSIYFQMFRYLPPLFWVMAQGMRRIDTYTYRGHNTAVGRANLLYQLQSVLGLTAVAAIYFLTFDPFFPVSGQQRIGFYAFGLGYMIFYLVTSAYLDHRIRADIARIEAEFPPADSDTIGG